MAAYGISTSIYILPNPDGADEQSRDLDHISVVQTNLTFSIKIRGDITTLFTSSARRGDDISGLVYVPTLDYQDPCFHTYVPRNATQLVNLPSLGYDLIGLAPWVSKHCSREFLDSAAGDLGKTKAIIFYAVSLFNKTAPVPPKSDPMWALDYSPYHFPIYAINHYNGEALMNKVATYSGNMTEIWDNPELSSRYNVNDYARVYLEVDTGNRDPLPGLWIFLLVIIGVLLFIVGFTSLVMHWLQYRYRLALRRRVANGEIDLESMGIKRLTIPQDILSNFPLRIYESNSTAPSSPQLNPSTISTSPPDSVTTAPPDTAVAEKTPAIPTTPIKVGIVATVTAPHPSPTSRHLTPPRPQHRESQLSNHAYTQTSCAICLEEYESGVTSIRELPCLHIFHPECIDPHLSNNSSLCPLCKASALPKGYVPPGLTNATVRRERNMRRMRERYMNNQERGANGVHGALNRLRVGLRGDTVIARASVNRGPVRSHVEPGRFPGRRVGSFSATAAPTQEEEDAEWRNMPRLSRFWKYIFPR